MFDSSKDIIKKTEFYKKIESLFLKLTNRLYKKVSA